MTAGADFTIYLKPTLHGGFIESTKRSIEAPVTLRQRDVAPSCIGWTCKDHCHTGCKNTFQHYAAPFDAPSTGSDIDFGNGLVVSKTLSNGRMTRKCRKYHAVAIRDNTT
jgi:hypothetical protein